MLYTIVPYEVIFPQSTPAPEYSYKNGIITEWRTDCYGKKTKTRIISTNLADYL